MCACVRACVCAKGKSKGWPHAFPSFFWSLTRIIVRSCGSPLRTRRRKPREWQWRWRRQQKQLLTTWFLMWEKEPVLLLLLLLFCVVLFCFFRAAPTAYGDSQAWGLIGAIASSLHHSHSNIGSFTHWARPGIKPTSSWILVGLVTAEPCQELQK